MTPIEKGSKSFNFALYFLPLKYRNSIKQLYSYCRYVDDLVDLKVESSPEEKLWDFYNSYEITNFFETHNINKELFKDLVIGVASDIKHTSYNSFDDLYTYCYKVGGTVGVMLTELFGIYNEDAYKYAEYIGIGMQLTNIIRDLKQDQENGRTYIPNVDLDKFGIKAISFLEGDLVTTKTLIQDYVNKADSYFNLGLTGVDLLPIDTRIGIKIAISLYREILREIERKNYNVYTERVHTSNLRKVYVVFKLLSSELRISLNSVISHAI